MRGRLHVGLVSRRLVEEWRFDDSGTPLDSAGQVPGASSALTWSTRYARTPGGQNAVFKRRGMEKQQVSGHSEG
jgi:hypothetical protein